MRSRLGQALAVVSLAGALSGAGWIQDGWGQQRKNVRAPTTAETGETSKVYKVNNWTVGLAGGTLEGTFIRLAAEAARIVNDPDQMRVLPVITQGAIDNVRDLLYLKGIDVSITNADVLEHFKTLEKIPNIEKRIHFISELVVSEIHLLVRPDINSIQDLEGKKVSFHTKGAGSAVSAPIIFKRLGVNVDAVYVNNVIALEKMKTGEFAGLVSNSAKPQDLFTKFKNEEGFKFLAIPIEKFDEYYIPSEFTHEDYPGYVKPGEKVETLAVQSVLAVYNWPRESDRYRRIERFIEFYFDRFEALHKPPNHPKWKSVNLAAKVPGWTRYVVAEEKLKAMARVKDTPTAKKQPDVEPPLNRQKGRPVSPAAAGEQEKLFQQFLEWNKKQGK
jgi:TRAP-type uncharacterized transport system substrate-binding protein